MNVFKLYLEERSKKKNQLSNKHAIDLFMPFVATLSIYILPIERSISFCLYNRLVLVRMYPIEYFVLSEMRKIFKQILWRCKCNLYVSGFEYRRFNSINVCTNAYPIAVHCDLSMPIYYGKLSICAWHVGNSNIQFHIK